MKIEIKTITPLHVGSGTELQGNTEYIYFPDEDCLAVIDPEKVLTTLGEENLDEWVKVIQEGKPLLPLLKAQRPHLKASDVGSRFIRANKGFTRPIREQIRTAGSGLPILPGSSLKGAIRTALFARLVLNSPELAKDRHNLGNEDRYRGFRWSDQPLQKTVFGVDPNHDIFRLLQVGDAVFENVSTEAIKAESINHKFDRFEIKETITQYVEAIPAGAVAQARIRFNDVLEKRAGNTFNKNASLLHWEQLFPLINKQTLRLLDGEIEYWDETAGNPDALGNGLEEMERVANIADACTPDECVIRIGWGSGFRSMTGDWHGSMNDDDYDKLLKTIRSRHPVDLIFPKTMRLAEDGMLLGFVKLSIAKP